MQFTKHQSLNQSLNQSLLTQLCLIGSGIILTGGVAQAQVTPPPIFQETFLGGSLTNTTPGIYTVGGTADALGSSICLTASQTTAQTPVPGCALNSAGLPATGDAAGVGALRLTSNRLFSAPPRSAADPGEEGFFIVNQSLTTAQGLVFEFEFFTYAGQSFGNVGGGDGFSFFLIRDDIGNNSIAPAQAGAFGGSLGYAQKEATGLRGPVPGLPGAYLGIGFDAFGNFSNNGEGRIGGNAGGVLNPNQIVLRGGEQTQYAFLQQSGPIGGNLTDPPTTLARGPIGRRGRITITPNNLLTIELSLTGATTAFTPVIQNFDLQSIPGQPALPPFFKFGFAASTGTSTAIHEIRNVTVRPINNPPPPPPPPPVPPAPPAPPPAPPAPPVPPPVQIFRLVKRVTAITRSGIRTQFDTFVDDPQDPNDNVPAWNQLATGLVGQLRTGNRIQTGDDVEYTIYYLAEGNTTLVGSSICDQVPEGSSFIVNSNQLSATNAAPLPSGRVFSKLQPIEPGDNPCIDQRNPNGSVLFNLGNLPVTPGNNFGFVRFSTKVN